MSKTFIIILAVIAVVILAVGVPDFIRVHSSRAAAPCINRLRQIDSAKQQWMLEQGKTTNDVPTWSDLFPYLASSFTNNYWKNGRPACPEGGIYTLGRVGDSPACSLGKQDPNHHALPE